MAATFRRGDEVTLDIAVVVPSGPIKDVKMDDDGEIIYLVEWVDAAGEIQARWFQEAQLKPV